MTVSPVLVGRDQQTAALDAAFASVRQGGPSAVLLGGEAGVGKSRLVAEFGRAAAAAGARVLIGGCLELGTDGLPYAPFTAVLRDLVHEMGTEAVAALLPGRATRELARLLPELGEPEASSDPGEARARLFEAVLSALEYLARRSPVVLVIEDAQWADRSSRDLLTFLIGNQRTISGLLIVATFRSDELHRTHPLRPLLAALDRITWVDRLDLPRLGRADTDELAARILGRPAPADLAAALYRRSEGNPLFVEALLGRDGELNCELPESLRDLLLESVRRLPDQTQDVLRVASAGGAATGHALLAAVTGLDEEALTRALRPAVVANVLRAQAEGYAFRHELIREAVHEDLMPGEHGRLHSRFAEAIDADPALVPPGRAAIEMAHHWYAAHDATWALIAAWRAAGQAGRAMAAAAERLALLARVLELWDQVPDAAERIGADHLAVLVEATCAAHDAGEFERGIALASSALRELGPSADPAQRALLLKDRGVFKSRLGRKDSAEDMLAALEHVPASVAPAARVAVLLELARCAPGLVNGRPYADEALRLARQIGDEVHEASALLTVAMFAADPGQQAGPGSEPITLIARARGMAERRAADHVLVKAAVHESHLLEGAGHHELAAAVARRGVDGIDPRRLSRMSGNVLAINEAEPLMALGRWDEAVKVAQGAVDVYLAPGPMHRAALKAITGSIALARGDLAAAAEAEAAARDTVRAARYEDEHQLPVARLEILLRLASDGPAAALSATGQVLDRYDLLGGSPRYAWPVVLAGASVVSASPGLPEAAAVADRLRAVAEKLEVFGPAQRAQQLTFAAYLAVWGGLGGFAGLSGSDGLARSGGFTRSDGFAAGWDAAAAAWSDLGEPYPQAQALLGAASAAVAGGDRDGAADRLRRADRLAAELGARPLREQIALLARRAGVALGEGSVGSPGSAGPGSAGSPGSAGPPGGAGLGAGGLGLTGREVEVLRLVAAGRSNREIAAELFISPKTASVHVSNILGKLGTATRGEAAAKARALRLFG